MASTLQTTTDALSLLAGGCYTSTPSVDFTALHNGHIKDDAEH